MFTNFFFELRQAGVPVSLNEYLTLMEAMKRGLAEHSVEDFYYLSRACLVKDERNLDRFDGVFGQVFKGVADQPAEDDTAEDMPTGPTESRKRRATKVWDKREFKNLDDSVELGTRNVKVALRRLRRFARQGAASELDLPGTIRATANNAGWLDLKMVPERHNTVKVLLFLDIGGSMDDHIRLVEELFSAARTEFKHLEHFYFHNCVYESVWRDNREREKRTPTWDVLHTFPPDYKLVFVGDATMSPYEITKRNGSVEHMNEELGEVWLQRMLSVYAKAVWLNPMPQHRWSGTKSTQILQRLMNGRMFPLTLAGLDAAMRELLR